MKTAATEKRYWKVVRDGRSCHGGTHDWSLPTPDGPGGWHVLPPDTTPRLCVTGYHVTELPACWYERGCTVYLVEIRGVTTDPDWDDPHDPTKIAVAECRLIREATAEELVAAGIYLHGQHECRRPGKSLALGNSTVTALGNSTVTAWENSTVTARDNSTVTAWNNSTVAAWDNSTVAAWNNSTVAAWNNSTVVNRKGPTAKLEGDAVAVEWTSGRAEFRRAAAPAAADAATQGGVEV